MSPRSAALIPDPKPPIDADQAAELAASGLTYAEIGRRLGYRASSVRRCLLENGYRPRKKASRRSARHGEPLYTAWKRMRARCLSPSRAEYAEFGAHGIGICREWESFDAFYDWAIRAGYQPRSHLVRKDSRGDFTPANCRWITKSEAMQRPWSRERRERSNRTLTEAQWRRAEHLHRVESLSCPEVARRMRVPYTTVLTGLKRRGSYVAPARKASGTAEAQRLYKAWLRMHSRCSDPDDPAFAYYGGAGASICREWQAFEPFYEWAREAGWEPQLCLTRRDPRRAFSPSNCAWTTRAEAARNARHPSSAMPPRWTITAFGETKGPTGRAIRAAP